MRSKLLAMALSAVLAPAFACGPDFPPELLSSRESTLLDLPEGTFAFEASRLVLPKDDLRAKVVERWRESAALEPGIDAGHQAQMEKMRTATSLPEAEALGDGLPRELLLYTAGAVAWHLHDYPAAQQRFSELLELPAAERQLRSVWAAYMLGRGALLDDDIEAADGYFAEARALRSAGFSDEKDLALSGFGESAGHHLRNQDFAQAVNLYAEQAARGDDSGRASLLLVARQLLRHPELLSSAIADPLVQKLVGAYAFTRSRELLEPEYNEEGEQIGPAATDPATAVERVLNALEAAGIKQFAGADRLAAAAYQVGKFDIAERYLQLEQTPLASWVSAKLALRAGKQDEAAAALALAAKGFAVNESWDDASQYLSYPLKPQCRIAGEQGVLKLARGDYVAAAEYLFQAGPDYWRDLAYVAERVLTLEELRTLTAKLAPSYVPPPPRDESAEYWPEREHVGNRLRYLSARRLLREGQFEPALAWFDSAELKPKAETYVVALKQSKSGDALARAEALSQAAAMTRRDGMQLIGYEGDPDYQIYDGAYDLNDQTEYNDEGEPIFKPRADLSAPAKFAGPQEQQRIGQTSPHTLARFHYRHVAATYALEAAQLVPARSQAFAALLCKATAYVNVRTPELGLQIYRRYLREGAFVPWGQAFGRGDSYGSSCPTPDFARVAVQLKAARTAKLKRFAKLAALPGLGVLGLMLALGVWFWQRRAVRQA